MTRSLRLGAFASVALAIGFVQHGYVVVVLGPGIETDALFAGYALPQLTVAVLGTALANVLVPLLAGEPEEQQRRDGWAFFLATTASFTLLAGLLALTAPLWAPLLVPGFDRAGSDLLVSLTRIQLIGMVFNAQGIVLAARRQAQLRFDAAALAPLVGAAAGLVLVAATVERHGVTAAAWAETARLGVGSALLLPALGRYLRPDWRAESVRTAWRRLRPLLAGGAYYRSDILVDRMLASFAPAGGLSLLFLGTRVYGAAAQVVNSSVAVPMAPELAVEAKQGRWSGFRSRYRRRLVAVAAVTVAAWLLVVVAGSPLLRLVAGHGGVSAGDVDDLWVLLVALVGILVGGAAGQVLSGAHYARGDTTTPTRIGVVGFTAGIGLKVAGLAIFGLIGVAVGTTLYYVGNAAASYVALERKVARAAG